MPEGTISYTYDAAGNMLTASSYNGSKLQMTYDSLNRVTQVIQTLPNGYQATISYSYDANSNRTGMTTPWGSFSYGYDALNRLTSVTNPQSHMFTFSYDADGRRTQMVAPNGVTTVYTYDNASRITSITATNGSSVIVSSEAYTYDSVGNRLTMTDGEGLHSYMYDNVYRLTAASHPAGTSLPIQSETFSYDPVGNRQGDAQITGYTYDAANELTSNSSFTYTYDSDGNQTGRTGATFSYDSQNELTSVTTNSVTWNYLYDVKKRRVEKSSGTASGQTVYYVYDGTNILTILDGSNGLINVFTNGLGVVGEHLLMHTTGGSDYIYSLDGLESTRAITDSSGNIVETYKYLAYGQPVIQNPSGNVLSASTVGNSFMFARSIFASESGLTLNWRRYYDPTTGRFESKDPIGFAGGTNIYAYAANNPIYWTDPFGLAQYPPDFIGPIPPGSIRISYPPSNIEGGPWTWSSNPQNSRGGDYIGAEQPGGKMRCTYAESGPNNPNPYWKTTGPKGNLQHYNLNGDPITPQEAHPGPNPSSSTPRPDTAPDGEPAPGELEFPDINLPLGGMDP
jgi:RHS repeat-associated protein